MERGCEKVQWDPLKPCQNDFGSCSLRVGSVCGATLMKNNRDGRAAPSNSLVKTFLQCSCNVPTVLLPLNHGLRCSQYVLRMFWSAFDVTLPHIITLIEARATFLSLALHHLSFTCQVHKYLWSNFYAKGLMKYIVLYCLMFLTHLFFYQCFPVPLIIRVKFYKCCL